MLNLLGHVHLHWTDIMKSSSLFAGADRRLRQRQAFIYVCSGESISRSCQRPIAVSAPPKAAPAAGLRRRFVCLCARMTETLREKDGAPESALTLTDLVFKGCRDFWFGVVLLGQSTPITTRFVCAEISQSNSKKQDDVQYFSRKRAYTT